MFKLSIAVTAAACAAGVGLHAEPARAAFIPEVAGWTVRSEASSCVAATKYDGPGQTELSFAKSVDGDIKISLTNSSWSAVQGQNYDLAYFFNGQAVTSTPSTGISIFGGRRGFRASFPAEAEQAFVKSADLVILKSDAVVDRLKLSGSGAAISQLNRCLLDVANAHLVAAVEKAKFADIPPDPFAGGPRDPEPVGPLWSIFQTPPAAIKERRGGSTGFRVLVDANGKVTDCIVTESSGHPDLDAATILAFRTKARFKPAIDKDGRPTAGEFRNKVNWSVPPED